MIRRSPDWIPLVPARYRRTIAILLAATPFVAGTDFLLGEDSASLTVVERSMPAELWGALLIVAGVLSVGGYVSQRPALCIAGLHLSGCLFFALSAGIAMGSINALGGFRGPWLYLVVAFYLWLTALGYADQIKASRGDRE